MLYHVIQQDTQELKTLESTDILDMDYDALGRVVITSIDHQMYFLIASNDIVSE